LLLLLLFANTSRSAFARLTALCAYHPCALLQVKTALFIDGGGMATLLSRSKIRRSYAEPAFYPRCPTGYHVRDATTIVD